MINRNNDKMNTTIRICFREWHSFAVCHMRLWMFDGLSYARLCMPRRIYIPRKYNYCPRILSDLIRITYTDTDRSISLIPAVSQQYSTNVHNKSIVETSKVSSVLLWQKSNGLAAKSWQTMNILIVRVEPIEKKRTRVSTFAKELRQTSLLAWHPRLLRSWRSQWIFLLCETFPQC